jgi:hypothetical protein
MKKSLVLILVLITVVVPALLASSAKAFVPFVETEQGFIGILSHTYQNGADGDDFDFRNEGGQEILFPFTRYSVGATIAGKHRVWFTYQPLNVVTNVTFKETREIGDSIFTNGTPMELTYSFPFYRMSYTYDLLNNYKNAILGVGAVLQIRNASIVFKSIAGTTSTEPTDLYVSQNLGLVPALAIYSQYRFPFGLVLTADIAGIYASSAFFNGADFEFEGSILDASLRMGYELPNGLELFGNVRFFGGTSNGVSQYDNTSWTVSDLKYTQNNIASLTASVGAMLYR